MASGLVMLLDVVAGLGGGVVATLRHGATTLVVGASTVGVSILLLAMIAVSFQMACTCLNLLADDLGTVPPKTLRRSAAAAMDRSCCKETGTWQWAGYKRQVLEKQKRHVAGM
jgi:hypothetical protein